MLMSEPMWGLGAGLAHGDADRILPHPSSHRIGARGNVHTVHELLIVVSLDLGKVAVKSLMQDCSAPSLRLGSWKEGSIQF